MLSDAAFNFFFNLLSYISSIDFKPRNTNVSFGSARPSQPQECHFSRFASKEVRSLSAISFVISRINGI
jgi:hypothetical protein